MIAIPIVDAPIITNVRTPVAAVPVVAAVGKGPIAGRPKISRCWRFYPDSGYPIIVVVLISPVARRPEISVFGARRLIVDRQDRRGDGDRNECRGKRRSQAQQTGKKQVTDSGEIQHGSFKFARFRYFLPYFCPSLDPLFEYGDWADPPIGGRSVALRSL